MPLPTITTRSVPDQILDRLRNAILEGSHQPGEALRIDELATSFGTSHMPVREALNVLVMEGLAERLPRRGVVVSRIEADDISQAYLTLASLEAQAARAAAAGIVPVQAEALRRLLATVASPTPPELRLDANRTLHQHIDAIAPNRWRDAFAQRLRNFIYRMRHVHPRQAARLAAVEAEHAALVDAIANGDGDLAARLAAAHCAAACADLLAMMRAAP